MPLPAFDLDLWENMLCQTSRVLISCLFHKQRLWEKSLQPVTSWSQETLNTRFHFLVAKTYVFPSPLTFAIFVTAAASTYNANKIRKNLPETTRFEPSIYYPICPRHCRKSMSNNNKSYHVSQCYDCGTSHGVWDRHCLSDKELCPI